MEKYGINLGYYYMKLRLQEFYLNKENKQQTPFKVEKKVEDNSQKKLEDLTNIDKIYLSVNYPGLLIGTGTTIEYTPFNKGKKGNGNYDNFKNGLSFDYTTGLPYIPGSGIKGVIRDFFPTEIGDKNDSEEEKLKYQEQNNAKTELINQILESNYTLEDIERIGESIFEGRNFEKKENFVKEEYLPILKRDKFIEGRIIVNNDKQIILDKDYITPHKKILENPVPIKILKIVPKTEIEILLQLTETKISIPEKNDIVITKEQKKKLFTEILFLTGLGAKTNVGYGHFDEEESIKITRKREEEVKKLLEKEKLEVLKKEKEDMSDFKKFVYEFKNEWNDETKKGKVSEVEKFEGEEQKEIANLLLEVLKKEKKHSKKTEKKIKRLEEILNS
jgi:CRISPR-associated RAMP protein, cmr6 family